MNIAGVNQSTAQCRAGLAVLPVMQLLPHFSNEN